MIHPTSDPQGIHPKHFAATLAASYEMPYSMSSQKIQGKQTCPISYS